MNKQTFNQMLLNYKKTSNEKIIINNKPDCDEFKINSDEDFPDNYFIKSRKK